MHTKLTLRLDEELIASAKLYSRRSGKSLSQIVADYFALLAEESPTTPTRITPTVQALKGCLRTDDSPDVAEGDYHRYLEEKYL